MTSLLAEGLRADRSFERMYRRHAGDVYRYALAVLRHPADAEDVTQTTFLNAYRAFQRGERPRQPQSWLIAIANNVCRQRFRQAARRPQEVAFDDQTADWLEQEERGPSADDLRRALGHIAFNQRVALVMRELEGRSYAEIADALGTSVSAVETLIFRARRAVREQLETSLTCEQAERALSLDVDGRLSRAERGALRAHLRQCESCAKAARSLRAQRSAFKALAAIPLPSSLGSLLGGGGATLGVKAAAVAAGAALVGGVGLVGEQQLAPHPAKAKPHRAAVTRPVARPTVPVASAPTYARRTARPVHPHEVASAPHVKEPRGHALGTVRHAPAAPGHVAPRKPGRADKPQTGVGSPRTRSPVQKEHVGRSRPARSGKPEKPAARQHPPKPAQAQSRLQPAKTAAPHAPPAAQATPAWPSPGTPHVPPGQAKRAG